MSLLSSLRDALRRPEAPSPEDRRQFVRRATVLGAAAVGGGLLTPDEVWAGIEERAARFGIVPGTVVDRTGQPMAPSGVDTFLGDVMLCGFNFAARGYAFCNGQLLPIAQNSALFSLLGTMYGGDGRTTFALPDLRGRYAVGFGTGPGLQSYTIGQKAGVETVVLTANQVPSHTHSQPANTATGTARSPVDGVPAKDNGTDNIYGAPVSGNAFVATTAAGGSQSHENRSPYIAMNYQIALQGVFPSRN